MSLESGNTREGESHTHKSTASNRQTPRRTAEEHGEREGEGKDWWGEEVKKDGGTLWWKETGAELSFRCFLFPSQWVIRILWGFPADSAFGPWALFVVGSHNSYCRARGRVCCHLTRTRCVVIKQEEPSWFSNPWTINRSCSLDFPLWKLRRRSKNTEELKELLKSSDLEISEIWRFIIRSSYWQCCTIIHEHRSHIECAEVASFASFQAKCSFKNTCCVTLNLVLFQLFRPNLLWLDSEPFNEGSRSEPEWSWDRKRRRHPLTSRAANPPLPTWHHRPPFVNNSPFNLNPAAP